MQHKTVQELERIAEVHPDKTRAPMARRERLERWAELLERDSQRPLRTLEGTEYQPREVRDMMRAYRSPITVAFDDPVLRGEGLAGDTYGDAKRFFELSDWQLHDVVCHCHHGSEMTAKIAAQRIRRIIGGGGLPRMFARLWE